jgi:hypothetical protein
MEVKTEMKRKVEKESEGETKKRMEVTKWHVRVNKQSCKQENHLILWGVGAPRHFFSRFFDLFSPKNLKKYYLTRPKVSKYSLTS